VFVGAACRASEAYDPDGTSTFDPAEVAGFYSLQQVDGHAIGWYHQMGAVDCQVAFIAGELEIAINANFVLDLDFNFRCLGTDPADGAGTMSITGTIRYKENGAWMLGGLGPNFVEPERNVDNWLLEVRPSDPSVSLRFAGFYRDYFADPVLTMGPRR
jgi:hypothetical protein